MSAALHERLAPGDLVLVTGASGLIGSWVVKDLISRGFRVRGITRDVGKTQPLRERVERAHGTGKLEFVQAGDIYQDDAFKEALDGVAGIIHLAVDTADVFSPLATLDSAIRNASQLTLGLLKTAARVASVKAAVVTSSDVAVYSSVYGPDITVSIDQYNDKAVEFAATVPTDHPFRGVYLYTAGKIRSEQAMWKWYAETKSAFSLNTVVPHTCVGPPYNPAPGVYTTSTWFNELFQGNREGTMVGLLTPGKWFIDVKDCAVLHVAALLDKGTNGQRLWAAGYPPMHINKILQVWRDAYPDHNVPADFDTPPQPHHDLDRDRSTQLLQNYAHRTYLPITDSLVENVKTVAAAAARS